MAIHDTWLSNLKTLVTIEGGGRKGIRAVADVAGLSEEYVYQLVAEKPNKDGGRREVGKAAASKIEAAFSNGRADGWFNHPIQTGTTLPAVYQPNQPNAAFPLAGRAGGAMDLGVVIDELAAAMLRTDPVDRAAAKAYLIGLCDAPDRLDLRDKIRATLEPPPAAQKPTPEAGAKRAA